MADRRWLTQRGRGAFGAVQLLQSPAPDLVVAGYQLVRYMRMEALDADTGAAHSSRRSRSGVLGVNRSVSFSPVAGVDCSDYVGRNLGLSLSDPTGSLKATHALHEVCADEVVARWHRRAIMEKRLVENDDRVVVLISNDDDEVALWRPTE